MKWYLEVFKKYAVFNGRARRMEYWYFTLFYFLFALIIAFISQMVHVTGIYYLFILISIVPGIAVGVRRMHDINKSGWFILIPIYSLILCCTAGTEGPNDYGPDPKRPEFEEFLADIPVRE